MLREAKRTPVPDSNSIDYVSAAHIVVSRKFLQQAGLMPEDYFLYYEETDWCLSLEGRNMVFLDGAVAYHVGGSSIGSATIDRRASPLSTYFMAKSRLKFVWKFRPYAAPIAFVFNLLKALQLLLRGNLEGGCSSLRGTLGLPPSATVRAKMGI
jgi:GT2 family glycosyltransferase